MLFIDMVRTHTLFFGIYYFLKLLVLRNTYVLSELDLFSEAAQLGTGIEIYYNFFGNDTSLIKANPWQSSHGRCWIVQFVCMPENEGSMTETWQYLLRLHT